MKLLAEHRECSDQQKANNAALISWLHSVQAEMGERKEKEQPAKNPVDLDLASLDSDSDGLSSISEDCGSMDREREG